MTTHKKANKANKEAIYQLKRNIRMLERYKEADERTIIEKRDALVEAQDNLSRTIKNIQDKRGRLDTLEGRAPHATPYSNRLEPYQGKEATIVIVDDPVVAADHKPTPNTIVRFTCDTVGCDHRKRATGILCRCCNLSRTRNLSRSMTAIDCEVFLQDSP